MKFKPIILFVFCFCTNLLLAQISMEFEFNDNDFDFKPIELNNSKFYTIKTSDDFAKTSNVGCAELPCLNKIINIPENCEIKIKEIFVQKDTIYIDDNILIAPKQKSLLKKDTNHRFFFNHTYYSNNMFDNQDNITIHKVGKRGENNLAVLQFLPLRYNPVMNALERIKKVKIEISFLSPYNKSMSAKVQQSNIDRPLKLCILSDENFKQSLNSFVKWKTMQGFEVTEIYTQQIGKDTTQIRNYLKEMYLNATPLNPPFDYLLIVGDTSVIPTFQGRYVIDIYPQHPTDLYYAEYTSDILPDLFYGRISANDTQTLNNIIAKTINYEKYELIDGEYLKNSLLVAGKELGDNAPTFTNGQMYYAKQYLANLTDTNVYYNPTSSEEQNKQEIYDILNNSVSWINYSGHGLPQGWQNPSFRSNDVHSTLSNYGKYFVILNNSCNTGKFTERDCFTTTLLQANNKGAVACIGSSDYTLWDEDYYWAVGSKNVTLQPQYDNKTLGIYDRLFHTHGENLSEHYITMGQILQAGCLAVTQSLSDYTNHYWEMYNLQGDPTLMPYVGIPKRFECNIPDTIVIGTQTLHIKTIPMTYIALSCDGKLFDVRKADSLGDAILDISNILDPTTINIVLTNQFYRPLIDSIKFVAPNKPFIALTNITITNKKDRKRVEFLMEGEEYKISFDLQNCSTQDITQIDGKIKLNSDKNLSISDSIFLFTEINSKTPIHANKAFDFKVKNGVKNCEIIDLEFVISQSDSIINIQNKKMEVFAPDISISSSSMQRKNDTVLLFVQLSNYGKKQTPQGTAMMSNLSKNVNADDLTKSVKTLGIGENDTVLFVFNVLDMQSEQFSFDITYASGDYEVSKEFTIPLLAQIETFEQGFTAFNWQNDEENPWFIDTTLHHSGKHCARSKSNLADNKKSRLSLELDNSTSMTISFYAKVSSEKDYDKFKFYVDNEAQLTLNYGYDDFGYQKDWQKYTFTIPDGKHTLCFSYEKDQSDSFGKDCAWIDDVTLSYGTDSVILSLEDVLLDNIEVYPNPANSHIYVNNLPTNSDITIIDLNGVVWYRDFSTKTNNEINVAHLNTGIYHIVVTKDKERYAIKKLIITR